MASQNFQQAPGANMDAAMKAVESLDRDAFTKAILGKSSPGPMDYLFPEGRFSKTWDMFDNLVQEQISARKKQQSTEQAVPQTTQQAFGTMPGPAMAVPSIAETRAGVDVGQQPGLQYPPAQFKALIDALPPTWQTPIQGAPAMFPDRPLQPVEQAALGGLRQAELKGDLSFPGSAIQPPSVVTKGMELQAEAAKPVKKDKLDTDIIDTLDAAGKPSRALVNKQTGEVIKSGLPGPPPKSPLATFDLSGGVTKEIAPLIIESKNAAEGALTTHDAVTRAREAVEASAVTLGPTATIRNKIDQVSQVLGVAGKDTEERLVNTRNVIRAFGQFSLGARKQLKGQGQVSDFEGKLIVKAESGEIDDMTLPELKNFLDVTDRLAKRQYDAYKNNFKAIKKNPKMAEALPFFEVGEWSQATPKQGKNVIKFSDLPAGK